MTLHASLRAAALLGAAAALAAAPAPKPIVLVDPPCGDRDLAPFDAREVRIEPGTDGLAFSLRLGAPLAKGMFTCVHVLVDADDNPETGLQGDELQFRAVLGSRFHPNDWVPPSPGIPAPLENLRLSWSQVVTQETAGRKEVGRTWQVDVLPGAPEVEGDVIRFTVPASFLARGTEWISAEMSVRLEVETWCGDQPLLVDHVAADEGLSLLLDGDDGDWSGAATDTDPGGELHPTLRHLDLRRLRVDHDAKQLLAFIDFDGPGFATRATAAPDLSRQESLVLLAEPVDSSYESPRRLMIHRGVPPGAKTEGVWVAGGTGVEISLPRTGLDSRTRVLAWSEARFVDRVPDMGSVKVPRRTR